jgi:tyrosine-specific transport protein
LIVYAPATLIALFNPNIFIRALSYAGGLGCAILLGLFPTFMVWSGRYKKKLPVQQVRLPGGKLSLVLIIAFVIFELVMLGMGKIK